ncbi:MAG: hypothetical protein WA906_03850, partial [Pacificimonas sp.]
MARLILGAGDNSFAGGTGLTEVFGTRDNSETVNIVGTGDVVLDPSFNQGGDVIVFSGDAGDYSIRTSGSSVIITGDDG